MKKGAPIQPLLAEGVGEVGGAVSVLRGAPHPNTALLWARWPISDEAKKSMFRPERLPPTPTWSPRESSPHGGLYADHR
jgi:ABC-type Fe3+ transport system substrate-binding protein